MKNHFEKIPQIENIDFKSKFAGLGAQYENSSDIPEIDLNISTEGFEKMRKGIVPIEKTVQAISEFIQGPIISDSFGNDHSVRREWRNKLAPELRKEYMRNKLRLNNIASVYGKLELLVEILDSENIYTPNAEKVRKLYGKLPPIESYGSFTPQEKNQTIKQVEEVCKEFLELVRQ